MGAIALVVPTGYSLGPALLLLASPVLPALRPGFDLNRQDKAIIAILLAYFVALTAYLVSSALRTSMNISFSTRRLYGA